MSTSRTRHAKSLGFARANDCPASRDDVRLATIMSSAADDAAISTLEAARGTLVAHGVEVFRVEDEVIQLATRVRSHLMDAGVALHVGSAPSLQFTVRAQSSDFPGAGADEMFAKVREAMDEVANARGFCESATHRRRILDPVDGSHVLDVWYELTFRKPVGDGATLLDDVRWALGVGKCIGY